MSGFGSAALNCPCLYLHTESSLDPSAAHISVSKSDLPCELQTLSPSLVLPTLNPISLSPLSTVPNLGIFLDFSPYYTFLM